MRNLSTNIEDLKNLLTHLTSFMYRVMSRLLKMNSSLHSRLVSSTYITCILCAHLRSITPPIPKWANRKKASSMQPLYKPSPRQLQTPLLQISPRFQPRNININKIWWWSFLYRLIHRWVNSRGRFFPEIKSKLIAYFFENRTRWKLFFKWNKVKYKSNE